MNGVYPYSLLYCTLFYNSRDRDALYARTERVGSELVELGSLLQQAVADVNAKAGTLTYFVLMRYCLFQNDSTISFLSMVTALSLGDGSSALSKVVRILNNNLQSLALIDARTDEVQARLKDLRVQAGQN